MVTCSVLTVTMGLKIKLFSQLNAKNNFEILSTSLLVKIQVFWHVTPCHLINSYRNFEGFSALGCRVKHLRHILINVITAQKNFIFTKTDISGVAAEPTVERSYTPNMSETMGNTQYNIRSCLH